MYEKLSWLPSFSLLLLMLFCSYCCSLQCKSHFIFFSLFIFRSHKTFLKDNPEKHFFVANKVTWKNVINCCMYEPNFDKPWQACKQAGNMTLWTIKKTITLNTLFFTLIESFKNWFFSIVVFVEKRHSRFFQFTESSLQSKYKSNHLVRETFLRCKYAFVTFWIIPFPFHD